VTTVPKFVLRPRREFAAAALEVGDAPPTPRAEVAGAGAVRGGEPQPEVVAAGQVGDPVARHIIERGVGVEHRVQHAHPAAGQGRQRGVESEDPRQRQHAQHVVALDDAHRRRVRDGVGEHAPAAVRGKLGQAGGPRGGERHDEAVGARSSPGRGGSVGSGRAGLAGLRLVGRGLGGVRFVERPGDRHDPGLGRPGSPDRGAQPPG